MARYLAMRPGILASNVVECGGFTDLDGMGHPDVQFHLLPFMVGRADRPPIEAHGLAIGPCFLRPKSRGTMHLRSAEPQDRALFYAGSFRPATIWRC